MKLPNGSEADVPEEKAHGYLLDLDHPEGGPKAKFLVSQGYTRRGFRRFVWDLRRVAQTGEVVRNVPSSHGTKYVVEGEITAPNGTRFGITTVWIILDGETRPRLVTAYPLEL